MRNTRKVTKHGHSLAVVIPAYAAADLELKVGDDVGFTTDVRRGEKVLEMRKVDAALGSGI